MLTKSRVDQIPILIHGAVQITPPPLDLYIGLIDVPLVAGLSLAFGPQLVGKDRRKPLFPVPHRLMSKFKATQQKHLRHIAVAELVTRPVEQRLKDDVGRHFDEVKRGAGAFVEDATAALAVKDSIAQIGPALQLGGLSKVAMRTVYETRAVDLT